MDELLNYAQHISTALDASIAEFPLEVVLLYLILIQLLFLLDTSSSTVSTVTSSTVSARFLDYGILSRTRRHTAPTQLSWRHLTSGMRNTSG